MKNISANELKTRGVASIESALEEQAEVIITVRGRDRYVVMNMESYNHLRVCELEAALYETNAEIARGEYVKETVEEHLSRISRDAE